MPQPLLPPTPGSSTDIKGKDGAQHLSSIHPAFELPPPAIHDGSRISAADANHASTRKTTSHLLPTPSSSSPRAAYPSQVAETVKARRRSSAIRDNGKDNYSSSFALPPPPARSRRIIQMKPRTQVDSAESSSTKDSTRAGAKASSTGTPKAAANKGNNNNNNNNNNTSDGVKKKQQPPSATSAAGRKIARKTAHSLIERRRRSKMNEEFAVLKGMIPACTGEMHKLAILQASIEYLRYLQDCVSRLQERHGEDQSHEEAAYNKSLPSIRDFHPTFHADPRDHQPEDVDMSDSDTASPLLPAPSDRLYQLCSVFPGLEAEHARLRHPSHSSVLADQRHYSFSFSAGASPAFGPQQRHGMYTQSSAPGSTLTSPALYPQSDVDQEATAALLMLNNDRRGTSSNLNARGLSVRDLLST
ncbi:hypothetical protein E4U41_001029 [Claviceps citrina]|nr:hypothetical protein E4U41_001029 [Claviceps citrina]